MRRVLAIGCALLAATVTTTSLAGAQPAKFEIVIVDGPGEGFNDPTPAAPVGGNTGTTRGQQRVKAFEYAASIWSARLRSAVPIQIRASFDPLGANVLGSAGPRTIESDFPNAPQPGVWYAQALANSLAGTDLAPDFEDLSARFSSDFTFYLGLDNQAPAGQNDLVAVLLHEFAHGLGFTYTANRTTFELEQGMPDSYMQHLFDSSLGLYWPDMTNAQRFDSARRFGSLVWTGAHVLADVPQVLVFGSPELRVLSPSNLARSYQFGTAAFGPSIAQSPVVGGALVVALDASDAAGPATTDGCSALTNAAAVAGKVALIERGTCGFVVKAATAQAAGAIGVIIYNNAANAAAAAPGMAGVDPSIVIPSLSLNRLDGLGLAGATPGSVTVNMSVDPTIRAGADPAGRVRLYAPPLFASGSSVAHFDTVASRNLLMEPSINPDLTHKVEAPFDLTLELFHDIGWNDRDFDGVLDDDDCEVFSNKSATIVIGTTDTGVPNYAFANGCTMADLMTHAKSSSSNHGGYVSGVAGLSNGWVAEGLISGAQKGTIQSTVARDNP
jgi:hypothetical protein